MGLMSKYNKGGVTFEVDIKDFKFVTLEELYNNGKGTFVYPVDGIYINKKGAFDDHPVIISAINKMLVDLPAHQTETVIEILSDEEAVSAIKSGKVGFTVRSYEQKKYKKTCYDINWEDVD